MPPLALMVPKSCRVVSKLMLAFSAAKTKPEHEKKAYCDYLFHDEPWDDVYGFKITNADVIITLKNTKCFVWSHPMGCVHLCRKARSRILPVVGTVCAKNFSELYCGAFVVSFAGYQFQRAGGVAYMYIKGDE